MSEETIGLSRSGKSGVTSLRRTHQGRGAVAPWRPPSTEEAPCPGNPSQRASSASTADRAALIAAMAATCHTFAMRASPTAVVARLLAVEGMTQVELAAALNTTPAAVSQWISGSRTPSTTVMVSIVRALHAVDAEARFIDAGLWRGPIRIPSKFWEPAFRPRARFRLPLRLEWSGSDRQRWRNAADLDSLLTAYVQIMVEGTVADIVTWVDPEILAPNINRVVWPRLYQAPWRDALGDWALL